MNTPRKKKRVEDSFFDTRGALGVGQESEPRLRIGKQDALQSKADDELRKVYGRQVGQIQEQMEGRDAAEESNLDILDRGSRYVRKNEKLKKFKV